MKKRFALVLALVLTLAVLVGCSAQQQPPAAAAPQACPECPKVDKAAIVAEGMKAAAEAYFNPLPSDSNNIKAPDVQKMIDSKADFFGVDIRAAADYEKGHLPGFINIPFATVGQNLSKFPKDKLVIVQCYTGQTASQVTGILRMMGYNAKNLHFGFQGVTENKLPTVK